MTRILAALAASAAFIVAAYAGEVEGTVQSVDASSRTITLDDGSSYVAAEGIEIVALAPGSKVKVTFDDGTKTAVAVEAM